MHIWYGTCQPTRSHAAGQEESVHAQRCHRAICFSNARVSCARASCTWIVHAWLGGVAEAQRGREKEAASACGGGGGGEARTLWCVLSLRWRASSNKVQKEKTAEENGRCFFPLPCVCVCVSACGGLFCASAVFTSCQSSLSYGFSIQRGALTAL